MIKRLRTTLVALLLVHAAVGVSIAQTPVVKHRLITQPQKMAVMDYVTKAVRSQWFPQDIGIIRVIETVKPDGTVLWRMSTILDNDYRTNPPREFAKVHADIVLFYPDKALPMSDLEKEQINEQLDKIVLDRVYTKPSRVHRQDTLRLGGLISDKPLDVGGGKFRILDSRRHCLDNCDHAVGYLFKPGNERFEEYPVL